MPRYQRVGGPVRSPHRLAATRQPTANGSRSGGVALLHQSRSALRRSELGHGHGQAIGAGVHGSAPWKTQETIVGLPRLLVLPVFSRFGGRHLSPLWHVVLPLSRRALAAAWCVAFVLGFGELPATNLLQPPGITTITFRIWTLLQHRRREPSRRRCPSDAGRTCHCGDVRGPGPEAAPVVGSLKSRGSDGASLVELGKIPRPW